MQPRDSDQNEIVKDTVIGWIAIRRNPGAHEFERTSSRSCGDVIFYPLVIDPLEGRPDRLICLGMRDEILGVVPAPSESYQVSGVTWENEEGQGMYEVLGYEVSSAWRPNWEKQLRLLRMRRAFRRRDNFG